VRIPRGAGQREDRYMHLIGGEVDVAAHAAAAPSSSPREGGLELRVEALESEIAALKDEIASLRSRLDTGESS